jgi:hypothetical protein
LSSNVSIGEACRNDEKKNSGLREMTDGEFPIFIEMTGGEFPISTE